MSRIVIGVGNPFRGDDAAGLEVARRLRNATAYESTLGGFELMDLWETTDEVIIVDATRGGDPAGTVNRFEPKKDPLPEAAFRTSHAIGVVETIEIARALGRLPTRLAVYGIEVESVETGAAISAPVAAAIERVIAEIDYA